VIAAHGVEQDRRQAEGCGERRGEDRKDHNRGRRENQSLDDTGRARHQPERDRTVVGPRHDGVDIAVVDAVERVRRPSRRSATDQHRYRGREIREAVRCEEHRGDGGHEQ
jgi:hypothetical protein